MADSSFAPGPMAKFLDMPHSPLFTLYLNTPESWMVESVHTRYDLDNIYLEEVEIIITLIDSWSLGQKIVKSYVLIVISELFHSNCLENI